MEGQLLPSRTISDVTYRRFRRSARIRKRCTTCFSSPSPLKKEYSKQIKVNATLLHYIIFIFSARPVITTHRSHIRITYSQYSLLSFITVETRFVELELEACVYRITRRTDLLTSPCKSFLDEFTSCNL